MVRIADPVKNGKPRLVRIIKKKIISGVCSGISYRYGLPTFIVRLVFILLSILTGIGAIIYIILWIAMPIASEIPLDYDDRTS